MDAQNEETISALREEIGDWASENGCPEIFNLTMDKRHSLVEHLVKYFLHNK